MDLAGSLYPRVTLLAWENTHNLSGGRVVPVEVMEATSQAGRAHGLAVHLDGARIFNAEAATGVKAARFAAAADTIAFCFSKGLGAPIGSVLCGPADLVEEARYLRKRLGGGMRQVGVIAAAARVALRDRERLAEDHHLARYLGERLAARFPGSVDPEAVATNMVMVAVAALPRPLPAIRADLEAVGVLTSPALGERWRLVTHRDVDAADVDRLVDNLG
jgi:threonine aldolase